MRIFFIVGAFLVPLFPSPGYGISKKDDPYSVANQKAEKSLVSDGPKLWQPLLVNSTLTASLLTHMVALSSQVPISLAKFPPVGGWKYVRFPNSLRASIVQLANEVWDVLHQATVNMDEVQQWMTLVPFNLKESIRVLRRTRLDLIPLLLPTYLTEIEKAGTKAADLANNTVTAFRHTTDFIEELQGGVFNTDDGKKEELRLAKIEAEQLQQQKIAAEKILKRYEAGYKTIQGRISEETEKFHEQLDKIPDSWTKLGQDIIRNVGRAVTSINPLNGIANIAEAARGDSQGGRGISNEAVSQVTNKALLSTQDLSLLETIKPYAADMGLLATQVAECCEDRTKVIQAFREMVSRLNSTMNSWTNMDYKPTDVKKMCEGNMTKAVATCAKVSDVLTAGITKTQEEGEGEACPGQPENNQTTLQYLTCAEKTQFDSELKAVKKSFQTLTGILTKYDSDNAQVNPVQAGGGMSDIQFAIQNSRMLLEAHLAQELQTRDRLAESLKSLGKLNSELKKVDLTEAHLDKVIELLNKIARSLTMLMNVWRNLLQFFSKVSVYAKQLKEGSITYAKMGRERSGILTAAAGSPDLVLRNEMTRQMVAKAQVVSRQSFMVYTLAKIYVNVSQNHLLGPLGKVPLIFTEESPERIQALREELSGKVDESQVAIRLLLDEEQRRFEDAGKEQTDRYNSLLAEFGGESEEITEIIREGQELSNLVGGGSDETFDYDYEDYDF